MSEDIDEAKIALQWVLTPIPSREKRETSYKSSTLPAIRKDITQISIPKIQRRRQKTGFSLGDLHANDWDYGGGG